MKFCYKCGEKIFEEAEICPKCGVRQKLPPGYAPASGAQAPAQQAQPAQAPQPAPPESRKSPGLAAVLSFLWCGLGHVYCGDYGFGIMMMLVYPVAAFLCSITIICIPVPVLMWLWGMFDAYGLAQRINRGEVK